MEELNLLIGETIKKISYDHIMDLFVIETCEGHKIEIEIEYRKRPGSVDPKGEDDIPSLHIQLTPPPVGHHS